MLPAPDFGSEEFKALIDKNGFEAAIVMSAVEYFEEKYKCTIQINEFILEEAMAKTLQSRDSAFAGDARPEDSPCKSNEIPPGGYLINHFKMGGLLCFWLRKLKPFIVIFPELDDKDRDTIEKCRPFEALPSDSQKIIMAERDCCLAKNKQARDCILIQTIYINEAIAFLTGFYFIYGSAKRNDAGVQCSHFTAEILHDYILSLRYNSHSPHSTAFIFESLFLPKQ